MKSLLQTKEWATLRQGFGWQAYNIDGISVLERQLPFGKSFLYAPEVTWEQITGHPELVEGSLTKLRKFLENLPARHASQQGVAGRQRNIKNNKQIFFRLEILDENPPAGGDEKIIENLKKFGFIKAFEELQPEYRQIIDITSSEEGILKQMKEKGRYNIKIAQRNSIVVEKSENIDDFYNIFTETAKRDGFSIRPKEYFKKMLEIFGENVELLTAKHQDKIIAAEIVSYYDGVASYLYGASSSEYRNVMAPYLLHWEAIKKAKEKGCKFYDLLAVNPEGEEKHKFAGIGKFKRQFGGKTIQIVGGYDLVFKPMWYKLFKVAEKYRRQ